ncbi:peptidoglycan-binding domain-containing protein [Streptomyces sp. ISL-100]|uniref:peptidoglycan-binding domain-containing protein n=1 Tax=Streptomyces sp. ISL-100 TaxID=2819173 RepID=UPI002035DFFA|nr:peptidoglycan-binding domain-containing protein [Streptomyces sp. ISL-100]
MSENSEIKSADEGRDGGLGRRRRWVIAVAVGAAVLATAGVGASMVIKSPAQVAAEAEAPQEDVLTATVEHRVLVSSVITRGEVKAGQSVNVSPQVSGGGEGSAAGSVITKMAVKAQDVLKNGQVLLEVSGRPVFVLKGKLPVYRDLRPGSTGDDVKQLQKALRDLGHGTGSDANGTFGAGTKSALNSFYTSVGYDPLPAQDDDGEALKAAGDTVKSAERALEDAKDARDAANSDAAGDADSDAEGDAAGDEAGDEAGATDAGTGSELQKSVDRAAEDLRDARTAYAEAQAKSGPMFPAGEAVFLESFPARVNAVQGSVGSKVSGTVMTVSAGKLMVQAYVPEYQKGLLRAGQKVQIYSELTGVSAGAKISLVAETQTVPGQSSGSGSGGGQGSGDSSGGGGGGAGSGDSGYLVQITPDKALDTQLTGQDVRLTIEAASTGGKALVVPITAITSGADGKTVVTVVTKSGGEKRVEVRPGTTGDGFVAVVPAKKDALAAGDKVVTGVKK